MVEGAGDEVATETLVFISYAHQDDEEFADLKWVTHFEEQLEKLVRGWVGKKRVVSVWRDASNLAGNHMLDQELATELGRSAVLVSICSPSYVDSKWCLWELERFLESAEATIGVMVGTRSRVFRVMKSLVELETLAELPEPLSSPKGYEFYDKERPYEEFHPGLGDNELKKNFYGKLREVAWEISELLKLAAENGTVQAARDRLTVYLAEPTTDVGEDYDRLRNELRFRGYQVLPARPLRGTADDITTEVEDLIGKCQTAVHVLGHRYGVRPEGTDLSLPHLQLDVVQRAAPGGLAQVVRLPPAGINLHPEQEALVARLDDGEYSRAEVLRVEPEAFTAHVLDRLASEPEREPAVTRDPGEGRLVYLLSDLPDREPAAPLRVELELRGHLVVEPRDGTIEERRSQHEELMVEADALLLYYGEATSTWLMRKLREVDQARAWGRRDDFCLIAVYVAPPITPEKEGPVTNEALVLPGGPEFKPGYLNPLFAGLAACEP